MSETPLRLFNSLTRELEDFKPIHKGKAKVYTCGPTVYNYQHIGNMRAYVFADTLGRTLSWKGYDLTHVINITDVGHLTSDADAGDDKMEKAAAKSGKSAWDIAEFYADDFKRDLNRLNVREPAHPRATEYVEAMIDWGKSIADKHCYELDGGLYFDISTVPEYGRLARAVTEQGEARIDEVEGKRHAQDFAIWRKTPEGETRQMEWDSPWGKGAPGWHLECSVMSKELLGHPFDIHTGGIDHREIHHPNEIAQNQAHSSSQGGDCDHSGACIWMHNNFLIDRGGKMSKSAGEFLRLQLLIDKGIHPLAYRLMCLQAHYRSELEFTWDNLLAAQTRLKRIVMQKDALNDGAHGHSPENRSEIPTEAQVFIDRFDEAMSDDLNTPKALTVFEELATQKDIWPGHVLMAMFKMDEALGLGLNQLARALLRVRPAKAEIDADEIEKQLDLREQARRDKNFSAADAIRDELTAKTVEIMDGDELRWEWRIEL